MLQSLVFLWEKLYLSGVSICCLSNVVAYFFKRRWHGSRGPLSSINMILFLISFRLGPLCTTNIFGGPSSFFAGRAIDRTSYYLNTFNYIQLLVIKQQRQFLHVFTFKKTANLHPAGAQPHPFFTRDTRKHLAVSPTCWKPTEASHSCGEIGV